MKISHLTWKNCFKFIKSHFSSDVVYYEPHGLQFTHWPGLWKNLRKHEKWACIIYKVRIYLGVNLILECRLYAWHLYTIRIQKGNLVYYLALTACMFVQNCKCLSNFIRKVCFNIWSLVCLDFYWSTGNTRYLLLNEKGEKIEGQVGVVRTNCIDCLDRTNVTQVHFLSLLSFWWYNVIPLIVGPIEWDFLLVIFHYFR